MWPSSLRWMRSDSEMGSSGLSLPSWPGSVRNDCGFCLCLSAVSSPRTSWLEKGLSEEVGSGTSIGKLASGLRSPGKEHTPFFSVPSAEDSPGRSPAVCWPCASGVTSITPQASNSESGGLEGQAWGGPQRTDPSLWPRQEAKALSRAGFKQCSGARQPSPCICPVCVCSYRVPSHCRAPAQCQAS